MDKLLQRTSPQETAVCRFTRKQLRGLLMLVTAEHPQLQRLYFDPRHALMVASGSHSMLWLRRRYFAGFDPFCLSYAACTEALTQANDRTPIEIFISDSSSKGRRRFTLAAGKERIVDVESAVPYIQPRAVLARRPDEVTAVFDPEQLTHLHTALMLVSDRERPSIYLMPRGTAPAFAMIDFTEAIGFVVPDYFVPAGTILPGVQPLDPQQAESAERWARATLQEFEIRESLRPLWPLTGRIPRLQGIDPPDPEGIAPPVQSTNGSGSLDGQRVLSASNDESCTQSP